MNTTFNKANVSVIGPWLVVLAMGLDAKFQLGFSAEWYGAAASLLIWVLTYCTPNKETE
jgi:hypothetical protein